MFLKANPIITAEAPAAVINPVAIEPKPAIFKANSIRIVINDSLTVLVKKLIIKGSCVLIEIVFLKRDEMKLASKKPILRIIIAVINLGTCSISSFQWLSKA